MSNLRVKRYSTLALSHGVLLIGVGFLKYDNLLKKPEITNLVENIRTFQRLWAESEQERIYIAEI